MSETKPELERICTIPLSRAWIAPRHQRTKRAVHMLKEYAKKHMKSSEIKIDTSLNEELWNRGITSPPRRITVKMTKDEDGVVTISMPKETKEVQPIKEEETTKNESGLTYETSSTKTSSSEAAGVASASPVSESSKYPSDKKSSKQ